MTAYLKVENRLVTCPYDEAHKVKESRLQLHIAKCKLNNLDKVLETCPFNATHLFERHERDYHLLNCADKAPLDRKLAQALDKNNPFKGRTAVPSYSEAPIVHSEENWELSAAGPGYKIPSKPRPDAIVEPRPMSKPAERRKLYNDLHRMHSEPDKEKPRQPMQLSETQKLQSAQQQEQNLQAIQNLGLGRGKPATRIAANIFDKPAAWNNQSQNDARVGNVINGISNLGLGRGQGPSHGYISIDDDNDFPALGFGRGTPSPKQNPRIPGTKPRY